MSESTWLRIRKYIDDHRNQAVYASIFIILLFISGFWWYLLQIGQVPLAYAGVGGSVFIDDNRDGVFDGTELGFPGALLRLVNEAGEMVTAVTDSVGVYGFNVPAGSYTLTMEEEAGWFSTTPSTVSFTLDENDILFVNFGSYFETEVDFEEYGSIECLVFRDVNLDGAHSEGEPGIGDVHVGLYDSESALVDEALTVDGLFSFTGVAPGDYTLVETVPDEYYNTTSALVHVTVEADAVVEVFFGLEETSSLNPYGDTVVYGFVYNDENRNKMRDAAETGIAGVTIEVFDGETLVASAVTDEKGFYAIAVDSGAYSVVEYDLPGWLSSTPNEVDVTVGSGDPVQVNFGDRMPGDDEPTPDITGFVYDDQDGDGLRETEEPGITGVSIELWRGETLILETLTGEDGGYSFNNLPLHVYMVKETQPTGWQSTSPDMVEVDLTDDSSKAVDFGETKGATIAGTVFFDANVNGVNNNENGISGVTIQLLLSDVQVASAVTDDDGEYSFTVLKAGQYKVVEDQPSGYASSTANSVDVSIVSLTGQTITVDFGDYTTSPPPPPPPPPTPTGTILCYVFHDIDSDEVWDDEESPVLGVSVDLYQGEVKIATVVTGEGGLASFGQRNTGAYRVVETDLDGWVSTTSNTVEFTLTSDETEEIEFGDRRRTRIMGVVYDDADEDGERDAEEERLEDVTVELFLGEVLVDDTVTSADGSYTFIVYEAGDYTVKETNLGGWESSTPDEVLITDVEAEEEEHLVDFGDYQPQTGEIWGIVFDDVDGDGEMDGEDEGIPGVVVSIYIEDELIAATTSDEDGEYRFTRLTPGVYEVRAPPIDDYFRTTPGSVMPLVEAGDEKRVDFGYVYVENPFGVIYGTVFNDKDGDLDRGFGELGLSDVTVKLWRGVMLITTETTNEYGCYSIRIDDSDEYTLEETDPEGWHSTTTNEHSIPAQTSSDNDSPWDFGDTLGAMVSGVVWEDLDRDGKIDTEETGIEGVTVELYLGDVLVDSTETIEDGSYSLLALASGDYTVEATDLDGYGSTTPNEVPVTIGELVGQEETVDFGDYLITGGTIKGTVFNDMDGEGDKDLGEGGLAGATVTIYNSDDEQVDETTTSENGKYIFEELPPGVYRVTEENPESYISTTTDEVVLEVEEGKTKVVNFGDIQDPDFIPIVGVVYDDVNLNGVQEYELGIPGVTVGLYEDGDLVDTAVTGVFGNYTLMASHFSSYEVRPTHPEGYTPTTTNPFPLTINSVETYEVDFGYVEIGPRISLTKEVKGSYSVDPPFDTVTVLVGAEVEYIFTVVNTGTVTLTGVEVVDSEFGTVLTAESLEPGEKLVESFTHTAEGDVENTAVVTAYYEDTTVSDEDSASCYVGTMGLTVTKEVGVTGKYQVDDDWSSSAQVAIGETVYYRFTVENTGTLPLYELSVEDDVLGSILFDGSPLLLGETKMNSDPEYTTAVAGEHTNTVTATGYWSGEDVSDTDSASYTGVYVATTLDLKVKGGDGAYYDYDAPVKAGEKVNYWYTLENTGTADLTYLNGYDDEGNDLKLPSSLAAGEKVTLEYTSYYAATPGDHDNYMVVYSKESKGSVITGDDVTYFAEAPQIEVLKEIYCWACAEWHTDSAWVVAGEDADFRFTVRNKGNIRLTGITVVDDTLGTITMPATALDPDDYTQKVVAWKAEAGTHSNTVTVTGDTVLQTVSDDDDSYYEGYSPTITLTKEVSIDEVDWYEYMEVGVGETVYYRFTVKNTGDGMLHDVYIDDSFLGLIHIGELDPDETVQKYDDVAASKGEHTNTATVYGSWEYYQEAIESTDSATYFGVETSITVDKKVKRGGDWYDDVDLLTGETVEYQYTVKNTGNVPLSNVQVVDDVEGTVTLDETTLVPGESATGTLSSTVLNGLHTNTATATGHYESTTAPYTEWDPEDEDSASYFGGAPDITMNKQIKDVNGDWVEWATLPVGGTAYYRFIITNTGDVGLSNIFVYDPDLTVTLDSTDLSPGETTYGYADTIVEYGGNPNNARVEGRWSGYDAWYEASAYYEGVEAYLQLTKLVKGYDSQWYNENNGPAYVKAGEEVEFRYIIANMCELPFKEVTLYDNQLGWITLPFTEIPGGESIDFMVTDTAITGPYENYADAQGKCGDYLAPPYRAYASYFGVEIDTVFRKDVRAPEGDWRNDKVYVRTGDEVEYRLIVENKGNVDLTDLVINDPDITTINVGTLEAGIIYTSPTQTVTSVAGAHINTATLNGETLFGPFTELSDSAEYEAALPSITVTKEVSIDETNWDSYVEVPVGGIVYFRFTVENTGDIDLTDMSLTDTSFGVIADGLTLSVGEEREYFKGITDSGLGLHENTATATGYWKDLHVEDTADASYLGYTDAAPSIKVTKKVSKNNVNWCDHIEIPEGKKVYFKFTLENTGNVELSDVELHDTTFGFIVCGLTLPPGETATYYDDSTAELDMHVNTARATGQWNDITVESEDKASYKGYPGFVIPEVPLGTVLSLATMLGVACLFKLRKFRR